MTTEKQTAVAGNDHDAGFSDYDGLNDLDLPCGQRQRKHFQTLQAKCALLGFTLTRSDPQDGPIRYFLGQHGAHQAFSSLADVIEFINPKGARDA